MNLKDAFFILFVHDFGNGPLFKTQADLVNQLLTTPSSNYFISKTDPDYRKAVIRLKVYLSQLFSGHSSRTITTDFRSALGTILQNRCVQLQVNFQDILNDVVTDLSDKNSLKKNYPIISRKETENYRSLFENIVTARYISIFTAREISMDLYFSGRRIPIIDFLVDDFLNTLKMGENVKKYRFNFPLEETCLLFWRGLKNEIARHITVNPRALSVVMPLLISNNSFRHTTLPIFPAAPVSIEEYKEIEKSVVPALLNFLSTNGIVNVFHLKSPVYVTPSIALNPNDPSNATAYLFLRSPSGEDTPHRLSEHEMLYWKLFVWDNLKINNQGRLVAPSDRYE